MNKCNTKLGQLLALVSRPQFEKCVKSTQSDKYCKGFSSWNQFAVMVYAQIANPNGLRSLENSLNSNKTCLYHLGIQNYVKRSTISYANNTRSCELYEKLFYSILETLDRSGRKKFRKDFYAIDATEISLNMHDFPWALFRSTMSGVKINMKYDINNSVPDYLFITNAKEHENNTLDKMKLKKGDTVAFDKGYCNYERFGSFCKHGIYFVTRLKDNAKYKIIERRKTKSKLVPLDQTIEFTGAQNKKKCPYRLRKIKSIDEKTGNAITILTNDFSVSAEYAASLYRARWNIEIFFKTIKQNLKIKKFYGETENAVKTQIWIALIVYLLYLKLRQLCIKSSKSFTHFICELKVCLFERNDLFMWFTESPPVRTKNKSCNSTQGELYLWNYLGQ
jgi:hypothetical protein